MKKWIWYFYFGIGACFVIAGFFIIFNYYAKEPIYIKESILSAHPEKTPYLTIKRPEFPYYGIYLAIFGIALFLITKFFYEKGEKNVKRTKKHG